MIELLRLEIDPTPAGMARLDDWWAHDVRKATQTPASELLRQAVKVVTPKLPKFAPAESVLEAALQLMSENYSKLRRINAGIASLRSPSNDMDRRPRELAVA